MTSRNGIFTLLYHTPAVVSQTAAMPFTPFVLTMAVIIFGDSETRESICLPGSKVRAKEDVTLEESIYLVASLPLNPCTHPALETPSF
ncbi:hypothetical protein [Megasphaera stantonii]|nr:hypothetical protein [Megasphaera stantonii]